MGNFKLNTNPLQIHTTKPSSLDSEPPPLLPELLLCTNPLDPNTDLTNLPEMTTNSWPTSLNTVNPTEPLLNSCSERNNGPSDTTTSSLSTLIPTTPTLLDTTNSPTRPLPR